MTFLVNNGPAFAMIPKNASMTLRTVVGGIRISNEDALGYTERIVFVRDPFDRLASAWSFLSALHDKHQNILPPMPKWQSYEEFVDWALVSNDGHVIPQVDHVTAQDGVFVPNIIRPLAAVSEYFPAAPKIHEAVRKPVNDYRRADVENRYAKDIELCRHL